MLRASIMAAWAPIELPTLGPCRVDPASTWKRQPDAVSNIARDTGLAHGPPLNSAICMQVSRPARRHGLCRTSTQANIVRSGHPALRLASKDPLPLQTTAERPGRAHI